MAIQEANGRIEDSSSVNGYLKKDNLRLHSELTTALSTITELENKIQTLNFDKNDLEHEVNTLKQRLDIVLSSEKEIQNLLEIAKERVISAESSVTEIQVIF